MAPEQADVVVEALREHAGRLPPHPGLVPILDVTLAGDRPCLVTGGPHGEPLDEALRTYGPAAILDALPRLQQIAAALDLAASCGTWHGALHPRDVVVGADRTSVVGLGAAQVAERFGLARPDASAYTAPDLLDGAASSPAADQYALAVIAYEWLFGQPVAHDADLALIMPALPDVDRDALAAAFTRALSARPDDRFADCAAFVHAVAAAAGVERASSAAAFDPAIVPLPAAATALDELPLERELAANRTAAYEEPDAAALPDPVEPPARSSMGVAPRLEPQAPARATRGWLAAAATLGAGLAIGAAGVWLARDRPMPGTGDGAQTFTDAPVSGTSEPGPHVVSEPVLDVPRDDTPAGGSANTSPAHADSVGDAPTAPASVSAPPADADAAPVAEHEAGLLVHSMPAGATVSVDGVPRGATPLAVRGLPFGVRRVTVSRPGYRSVERDVELTLERPSRALEFALVPAARGGAPAAAGSLLIDSRPAGASAFVDGRAIGVTPLVLSDVAPGMHVIRLEHPGHRTVTTSVVVRAGERARVAARLEEEPEQE